MRTGSTFILAVAVATSAAGEVRLRPASGSNVATVQVTETPRGPWTPVGHDPSLVLNAGGDLAGDGPPAWAPGHGAVAIAWTRSPAGLGLAIGSTSWREVRVAAARDDSATPLVATLGTGWVVAFQARPAPDPAIVLVGFGASGATSRPVALDAGRLIALTAMGDLAFVASARPDGTLIVTTVSYQPAPEPYPFPAIVVSRPIERLARLVAGPGVSTPVPANTLDLRIRVGTRQGEPFGLMTWWVGPGELHWIALDVEGPSGPVVVLTAPGRSEHPESLVTQAWNEARRR